MLRFPENIEFSLVTSQAVLDRICDVSKLSNNIEIIELQGPKPPEFGKSTIDGGRMSFSCLTHAIELCKRENFALVTAPISKYSWFLAGHHYPGHTELLAEKTNSPEFAMTFVNDNYRVMLHNTHLALKNVSKKITPESISAKIKLARSFLNKIESSGEISVLGLNPQAGENGLFGNEEELIQQGINLSRDTNIKGPFPADAFFRTWKGDGLVLAMYHDQGLIPFKMIAKDKGVNLTLGLPFIRTSPDHGTAFEIAGKNIASEQSMVQAIKIAIKILNCP